MSSSNSQVSSELLEALKEQQAINDILKDELETFKKFENETKSEQNIYAKLLAVQSELKAPKNQKNKFGNYNYRSCEDILEAVKPLLSKYNLLLFIEDTITQTEKGGRYYIKTTATVINPENPDEIIKTSAFARESESKKGMNDSQLTGATSSYARKYALNALFLIDDTKDADTDSFQEQNIISVRK